MSIKQLTDFKTQMDKLRMFLPQYLEEHGHDVKDGHKIRCLSPDHDDHTPSMSMFNTEEGYPLLRCHGCNTVMDIFNVANVLEGRPIMGAGLIDNTATYLADKYGVELVYKKLSEDDIYELNMYQAYEAAANYIISQEDFNELQIAEMKKRNFSREFMKAYKVGICNDVDKLREHLKSCGYMASFIDDIDLGNKRIFNSNNIIYTICDDNGRPVAFQARNLAYDGKVDENTGNFINGPKFIGSTISNIKKNIYRKKERLYLLDKAKRNESVIVVEGNSDALSLHNNGITNAVGICGLNFSEHHLNTLRRNAIYEIIMCLDNDDAGIEKAKAILDDVASKIHDIKIKFIFLPDEYDEDGSKLKVDPDEYIRRHGKEAFKSLPVIDSFSWRLQRFDSDTDPEVISLAVIPIICAEPSYIRRERMINELALYTGYSDKVIRDEIEKIESDKTRKVETAKKRVLENLVRNLEESSSVDAELALNEALTEIYEINQNFNAGIMETSSRINNILAIKEYQEDTDSFSLINWGKPQFHSLNAATDGDTSGKVIFIGGGSNVGKTSWEVNLAWRIVENNPDSMVVFLSIDDSAKELLPRICCFDACLRAWENDDIRLFKHLDINKFAKPDLYKDNPVLYASIKDEREIFYKKFLSYAREDRFVLYDSIDGRSLDFIETLLRTYRDKYPNRRLYFFLDNFHLVQLNNGSEGREKYKTLSHEIKALAVKYNSTIVSTVEYTKMPLDQKPDNNNIAESNSLVYDSNLIMHGWNELHGLREKATAYHIDPDDPKRYKRPIVEWAVGKNKIAAFKGNIYTKSWPEKAFFVEISETEYKTIVAENTAYEEGL